LTKTALEPSDGNNRSASGRFGQMARGNVLDKMFIGETSVEL
jgi:hypothetical protein